MVLLKGISPSPGEHCRHALHDALEPQRSLHGQLGVLHPVHQPMKHHEHTVVVLGHRHLVEVAVCFESQQPALLAQHRPPVVQVPLVAHNHYGRFLCVQVVFSGPDGLNEPADGVEAGPVADAVDENVAVRPLDLLFKESRLHRHVLQEQTFYFYRSSQMFKKQNISNSQTKRPTRTTFHVTLSLYTTTFQTEVLLFSPHTTSVITLQIKIFLRI